MLPYPLESDALIDDLLAEVDRIAEEARASFAGLGHEPLTWRPRPDRWSIGECLAHLVRINQLYRDRIAPELAEARARGLYARRSLRGTWFGRWFTRAVGPMGRRMPTPPLFQPREEIVDGDAVAAFLSEQRRLRDLVEAARGLDLDAIRLSSPSSALLRFRAGDALRMLVEHEKRHLAQAQRVTAETDFPREAA